MMSTQSAQRSERTRTCVLIVAGLDPSGGAGLAADLRASQQAGAWGAPCCAVLTVQSTAGLVSAVAIDSKLVLEQAREVLAHEKVGAIKTGALGSAQNVWAMVELAKERPELALVVDPVMVATRTPTGARLLDSEALRGMVELFGFATVVTPNLDEAQELLGRSIETEAQMELAARDLKKLGPQAVLVKGGHLKDAPAIDMLALEDRVVRLQVPRIEGPEFHGGGCTFASLIAGRLALLEAKPTSAQVLDAVQFAKTTLTQAIEGSIEIGEGLRVLEP